MPFNTDSNTGYMLPNQPLIANHPPLDLTSTSATFIMPSHTDYNTGYMQPYQQSITDYFPFDPTFTSAAPIVPLPMLPRTDYDTGYMPLNQSFTISHFSLDPTFTSAAPIVPSPIFPRPDDNTGYMPPNQPSTASHTCHDSTSTPAANTSDHFHEASPSASASASSPTATASQPINNIISPIEVIIHDDVESRKCIPCGGKTFTRTSDYLNHCKLNKHLTNVALMAAGPAPLQGRFFCPYPTCCFAEKNGGYFTRDTYLWNHVNTAHKNQTTRLDTSTSVANSREDHVHKIPSISASPSGSIGASAATIHDDEAESRTCTTFGGRIFSSIYTYRDHCNTDKHIANVTLLTGRRPESTPKRFFCPYPNCEKGRKRSRDWREEGYAHKSTLKQHIRTRHKHEEDLK
ncbi:hypothetical protein QBC32DRAFT_107193 [Pseudoneurospora amorphoporcata]|uniref:Uncharacterized protein n=1 Tax=Pseudoneurospora amorphoporcata TaxID=241081 RepID=A0AAN6P1H8_9PEZI|nr:hypothetical protein QBC32DRAFT_107193 [Pseudoneurospora amorphoporcata]